MRNRKGSGEEDNGPEGVPLWKEYVRGITPLNQDITIAIPEPLQSPSKKLPKTIPAAALKLPPPPKDTKPQLDARTDDRLRRGRMDIEGTLDLHGMRQDEAHLRLNEFILGSYQRQKRCVLVITGKGRSEGGEGGGILKRNFPLWAGMPPLNAVILKIQPAIPRDGGSGAWYVYLKRQREKS